MIKKISIMMLACGLTAGCSVNDAPFVYKVDITQGNVLEQKNVDELAVGMNREQVTFLLGSPVLMNALHSNRWDYYYSYRPEQGKTKRSNMVLHFENNLLVAFEQGDSLPA